MLSGPEELLSQDPRWQLATRITSSRGFAKAGQLRDLLLYLVRQSIARPGVEPAEQEIGCQVLGRKPDYDTQADNIVRVQMRHLRQKLEEYFAGEGAQEAAALTIPKGSRIPQLILRNTGEISAPAAAPALVESARRPDWIWLLAALAGVAVVAFLLGRFSVPEPAGVRAGENLLWRQIFRKDQPTTIVLADSSTVFLQDVVHSDLTMDDYTRGRQFGLIGQVAEPRLREALELVARRQYTSLADATLSSQIQALAGQMGGRAAVRFSRHMNIRDFNLGSFVLVGSKRGIPWVELFEKEQNFVYRRMGEEAGFGFLNRSPKAGELARYESPRTTDQAYETYATMAMLPNVTHTAPVLLLDGMTMEATEAAGEYAMSGVFSRFLRETLGAGSDRPVPYFEVLLKVKVTSGAPHNTEVVAWRRPVITQP